MAETFQINCSDAGERARFLRAFSNLRGMQTITVKQNRKLRSPEQNRKYWGQYVSALRLHLAAQGEPMTDNLIHELFKAKFLKETIFCQSTGEVLGERVRSTTELNTKEFTEYLDQIAVWLGDFFGIDVEGTAPAQHVAVHRVTRALPAGECAA